MNGLIGQKIGMTRIFTKEGKSIPITVIEIKKNIITQIIKNKKNNFINIQLSSGIKKNKHIKKSEIGHFIKSGNTVGKILKEFKYKKNKKLKIGQIFTVNYFKNINKVNIKGKSKGKGFSGTIKRWNFKSQDSSHGNSLSHRAPGSIGQNQTPGRVFKGKKMAGQLGNTQVTVHNLKIIRIDELNNLLLIKGSVPGTYLNNLIITPSIKK